MNRRLLSLSVIVGVCFLLASACNGATQIEEDIIRASGFVEGRSYTLISLLGGTVKSVEVMQGEEVGEGDRLVQLDDAFYVQLREQAQAGVNLAEADLDSIDSKPTDHEIEQSQALLDSAEADLDGAIAALDLLESIYSPGDVPDEELHRAESAIAIAEAGLDLAKAKHAQVLAGPMDGERLIAEAALRGAQANLAQVELQLEDLSFQSPVAGRIEEVFVHMGETVAPASPIVRVLDPTFMAIKVYVPESQVAILQIGDSAEISADAYPEEVFKGSIGHISDRAQFTPTLVLTEEERVKLVFEVEVLLESGFNKLKPGMPVDVVIETSN